nr:mitochondrial import receptor subunit TOM6 homolog [Anolis sagrei ordinatus]
MAPGGQTGSGSSGSSEPVSPESLRSWVRGAYRFATDRNDFRRNLIVNLGLFAVGVWVARNLTDIDLMAPQPVA